MGQEINLRKAEKKVFSVATQDGMTDIFIGCIFLMFAIAPFLSPSMGDFWSSAIFAPFWAIVMLAIWIVRRQVLRPRIGTVEFGPARKIRMRRFYIVMFVLNVTAFVLGISALIYYSLVHEFSNVPFIRVFLSHGALTGRLIWALFGPLCLVFFSIAGYFLNFPRLYVYGLLTGLSPFVGEWLWLHGKAPHHGIPVTFGITAAIMILTGLVVFVRLLRNNPLPEVKDISGEA